MSKSTCVPLELVKRYSRNYPKCWEKIEYEKCLDSNEESPTAKSIARIVMSKERKVLDKIDYMSSLTIDLEMLSALSMWRKNKQIYSFYGELEELLYEQATEDFNVPVDVLQNLPFPCIFIETKKLNIMDILGFFAFYLVKNNKKQFHLVLVTKDLLIPVPIYLAKGQNLKNVFSHYVNQFSSFTQKMYPCPEQDYKNQQEKYIWMIISVMQLLLYICAQNAEISEKSENRKVYKKSPEIKDQYKEVHQFECGKKISEVIRKTIKVNSSEVMNDEQKITFLQKIGSKKRPHVRKGHWHHYWVGSKKEQNRQLKLNWIAPSVIHQEMLDDSELPITINQVVDNQENKK